MNFATNQHKTPDLLQLLPGNVRNLVHAALLMDSCIAGGFAIQLARHHFRSYQEYESFDDYDGDIDIYMTNESRKNFNNVIEKFKKIDTIYFSNVHNLPGVTNIYVTDYRWKIQLITGFDSKPLTVLDTFDIENCQVAYTHFALHFTNFENWTELERFRLLSVKTYDESTLHRVMKYLNSRGYQDLDRGSKEQFMKELLKIKSPHELINIMNRSSKVLSNSDKLLLSSILPKNNYNTFFKRMIEGLKQL